METGIIPHLCSRIDRQNKGYNYIIKEDFTMQNSRIAFWDNVKFVMILLMVLGHFADIFTADSEKFRSLYLFIYAFHMPVLFFVSGLFFNCRRTPQKVMFYISCGFALKIAFKVVHLCLGQKAVYRILSDVGVPWFVFALAAFQLILYFFREIDKKYLFCFAIVMACFAGYDKTIGDYLYLSRIIIFFPFYLLGTILNPEKIIYWVQKHQKVLTILAAFTILLWLGLCFFRCDQFYIYRHLFTGRNYFSREVIKYGPFARLFCYVISLLTGAGMLILIPKKQILFLSDFGARTLNVYFWHYLFYFLLEHFFHINGLYGMGTLGKAAYLLLSVILCIVLSAITIFEYPLKAIREQCFKKPESQ